MQINGYITPKVRIRTGLHTFDMAFENQKGDVGFPLGTATEIYGATNCGKSTITYSLSGLLANRMKTNIALADFEGFDPVFLESVLISSGFDDTLFYIQENHDEKTLDTLASKLSVQKWNVGVGILDSIGAISPIAEAEGDLGESNMGRRAFLMAQFSRKIIKVMREETCNKVLFMINHAYPKIGGRGMDTPGGEVKKYLASIRISVKRKYFKGKYEEYPDGSYVIEGTVVKNRWGYKDRTFNLVVLAGSGIHAGLTAVFDAVSLGLVNRDRVVKIGNQSFGYLKDIFQKAHEGDAEFFSPFFDLLANAETKEYNENSTEGIDNSGADDNPESNSEYSDNEISD